MIETGGYELEQSLVIGRYGSACNQSRVEALAILNENPHRARRRSTFALGVSWLVLVLFHS